MPKMHTCSHLTGGRPSQAVAVAILQQAVLSVATFVADSITGGTGLCDDVEVFARPAPALRISAHTRCNSAVGHRAPAPGASSRRCRQPRPVREVSDRMAADMPNWFDDPPPVPIAVQRRAAQLGGRWPRRVAGTVDQVVGTSAQAVPARKQQQHIRIGFPDWQRRAAAPIGEERS